MRALVAGATGVIGSRAVVRLREAGWDVLAIARSEEKAESLRGRGCEAVVGDPADADAVGPLVAGVDAVVNLATHIPAPPMLAVTAAWRENDTVRRTVSRTLADAALAAGVGRYVQESITFLYADGGDGWLDESARVQPEAHVVSALDAEAQAQRVTDAGGAGVVLRFAAFLAPDSGQCRLMARAARLRTPTLPGSPDAYYSSVHIDDAASAVVAALSISGGVYNVVDDEPLRRRDHGAAIAAAVGSSPPPDWAYRAVSSVPPGPLRLVARSHRVTNRRLRETGAWTPRYRSAAESWRALIAEMGSAAPDRG